VGALLWGELRRRWRSAAAIGVVLGIGFAAVLTAAAGARRTDTAFPRMLDATNAPQLLISSANEDSVARQRLYDGLADVHGVEQVAPFSGVGLVPMRVQKGAGTSMDACSNLAHDRRAWFAVGVPNVVDGRLPHPDRSDEVLVTHSWAETFGSRPGDELDLVRSGEGGVAGRITGGDGPVARATVVGVGVLAAEVVPISDLDAVPRVVAGPAFLERHAPEDADRCYDGAFVVLAQGALIDGVTADIDSMAEPVGGAFVQDLTGNYDEVRRAIQPQVTALWLFAVVSALASLLVVGQLLGRQLRHTAGPSVPVWRALGVTKSQIRALVAAPSVVTAMVGTGVAVTAAVLLSSRFPIGPARLAETARGVRVDGWIHVGGGLLAAMTALAIGLATTALVVESGARKAPVGRTARMTAAASKPAWILGIYLTADSGRGDRTVPTRSAVAGTALCVAAALSTVTFSRGLHDLVSEPARYGRDWDVMLDASFGAVPVADVLDELGDDRSVAAIAGGRYGEVTVDGRRVPTVGLTDLVGTTFPALIEGRAPGRNDEIVLGKRSLAAVGRSVGDRVSVDTGTGPVDMTVVGTAAFPRLNHGSFSTLGLGVGAAMRAEAFPPKQLPDPSELPPDFELDEFLADGDAFEFVTIRVRDGATAAERGGVVAAATRIQGPDLGVLTEQRPTAIDNYAAVSSTPAALAALLGFMAAATLAHLVVSVVRRRRRDLALCAALGMDRRQLSQAVVVQAVIVAGAALLVGLPLGVLGGRLAWTGFASELGVADQLQLPLAALSLSVPAVIVGAVAVALVPAIFASRTSPGLNLRSE
jgi:hypothetical protein